MLNIIIFGPPGSGKGTQAKLIAENFQIIHISTGDLFRSEMAEQTELGQLAKSYISKGELVPDEVTIGMLNRKMNLHPGAKGFLLDGFPRTIPQAKALEKLMEKMDTKISFLVALEVPDDAIVSRILKRGEASGRSDDQNEQIIRNRIEVYRKETSPLLSYYEELGIVQHIPGLGSIEEIAGRIAKALRVAKENNNSHA